MKYERQKKERATHRTRDMAIYRYSIARVLSFKEIGAKFGLSGARASQIASRIAKERAK